MNALATYIKMGVDPFVSVQNSIYGFEKSSRRGFTGYNSEDQVDDSMCAHIVSNGAER